LGARDVAVVRPHGPVQIIRDQNVDQAFAFTRGVLVLHKVQLRDAIPDLDRWYDVRIQVTDSTLATNVLDGEFLASSKADFANLLRSVFNARVIRHGRDITLYPR
jgi:ferric-dicitrate binding protein FerR (iron transport regulator)